MKRARAILVTVLIWSAALVFGLCLVHVYRATKEDRHVGRHVSRVT